MSSYHGFKRQVRVERDGFNHSRIRNLPHVNRVNHIVLAELTHQDKASHHRRSFKTFGSGSSNRGRPQRNHWEDFIDPEEAAVGFGERANDAVVLVVDAPRRWSIERRFIVSQMSTIETPTSA